MGSQGSSFAMEDVFKVGPETLVAAASNILAGPVAAYAKKILSWSAPPDSIPLQWTVSGRIERFDMLKGPPLRAPILFSRFEQYPYLQSDEPALAWEQEYGWIEPNDTIVVFLGEGESGTVLKTIPSKGDLINLVGHIIRIHGLGSLEKETDAWIEYLGKGPTDGGRKVALRSLMNQSVNWQRLQIAFNQVLKNKNLSREIRMFAFGILVSHIISGRFSDAAIAVVEFLCQVFASEANQELVLTYTGYLGTILRHCEGGDIADQRIDLCRNIFDVLKERKSIGLSGVSAEMELEEYYQEVRNEYLELDTESKR